MFFSAAEGKKIFQTLFISLPRYLKSWSLHKHKCRQMRHSWPFARGRIPSGHGESVSVWASLSVCSAGWKWAGADVKPVWLHGQLSLICLPPVGFFLLLLFYPSGWILMALEMCTPALARFVETSLWKRARVRLWAAVGRLEGGGGGGGCVCSRWVVW